MKAASSSPFAIRRRDAAEQVRAVEAGLPYTALEELAQALALPPRALREHLRIAERTLARRKRAGRLAPDESERILRYAALFERAVDVLENEDAARTWLKTPKRALNGATPLAFAQTEPGAREVERLLGRIEYGVFS